MLVSAFSPPGSTLDTIDSQEHVLVQTTTTGIDQQGRDNVIEASASRDDQCNNKGKDMMLKMCYCFSFSYIQIYSLFDAFISAQNSEVNVNKTSQNQVPSSILSTSPELKAPICQGTDNFLFVTDQSVALD